jgi:hypothetical protein
MGKRCLNSREGSGWRQRKQVVLLVFPVPERRTPYLPSTVFIPSFFVSVLTSGKQEEWEKVRVRILP